MTKEQFEDFISQYDLYSFDGLLSITLCDGTSHRGVWILFIPELGKSTDNDFAGLPEEYLLFYVFDAKMFAVWSYDQIEELQCLQQNYLK